MAANRKKFYLGVPDDVRTAGDAVRRAMRGCLLERAYKRRACVADAYRAGSFLLGGFLCLRAAAHCALARITPSRCSPLRFLAPLFFSASHAAAAHRALAWRSALKHGGSVSVARAISYRHQQAYKHQRASLAAAAARHQQKNASAKQQLNAGAWL